MITKFRIEERAASTEFGLSCQRLIPWTTDGPEPPLGVMACFLPLGTSSAPDCHDQDEVMIVLAGSGTLQLGDELDEFTAGDVLVLPRNQVHVVHNPGVNPLTWVSMYWPLHEPGSVG
jgi:mannose-6-phosphate isomerase-like protein (cupin superfamily)